MTRLNSGKLSKKQLTTVITAGVLALLIIAYVIIQAVISASSGGQGGGGAGSVTYDEALGESAYMGSATVYPYVEKARITSITVGSEIDTFTMQKARDADGKLLSYFLFCYMDSDGKARWYVPPITSAESGFNYTDLYSIETADGLNAPKIDYLCATIGALYYDYKVALKEDPSERERQLELYGLDKKNRENIVVNYLDENGEEEVHRIYVGDKLIHGVGYYFMLEGRDVIYAGASSERFSYALGGFENFLHSRIIAAGLPADGVSEPYLTTDYKQWDYIYRDVLRDERGEPVLDGDGREIPYSVTAGSEAIIYADYITPIYKNADKPSVGYSGDGYIRDGYSSMNVDLSLISSRPAFSRMVAALVGREVNRDTSTGTEKIVTVIDGMNEAVLKNGEKGKYEYTILAIDSVLSSTDEVFTEGTPVLGNDLIKVTYTYTLDGEALLDGVCHAILDLSAENALPDTAREELRAASVGALPTPVTFSVYYTEDNALNRNLSYTVTKITSIVKLTDEGVEAVDKVDGDSVVTVKYFTTVKNSDGTTTVSEEREDAFDLSAISGDESDPNVKIKNALIGKGAGDGDIKVDIGSVYYQIMDSFTAYSLRTVEGFVEKKLTVSFRYANKSEQDPFYRESTYKNTIGEVEKNNPFAIYPLNVDNCDKVVKLLGGIGLGGSSQGSEGLVGKETVAVGLTSAVMRKYGLLDGYSIYFELPRGIGADEENPEDYAWKSELGFNLYISAPQEDGTRYVGSEMYDIVVKVDAESFDFVERSFAEFWARRNLVMIDYSAIDKVELDLNMADLKGGYRFDLDHQIKWIYQGKLYDIRPEAGGTEYDFVDVITTVNGFDGSSALDGVYNETALSRLLSSLGREKMTLGDVYSRVAGLTPGGGGLMDGYDSLGTAMFKEQLMVMFNTFYNGTLTEAEQAAALNGRRVMTMSFDVTRSSASLSYVYDFYRLDEERVMVSFYTMDSSGAKSVAVNDFYLSNFSFKKIVANYINILSGVRIDADVPYPDVDIGEKR